MIGIINYGMGNLQSVANALDHLQVPNLVVDEPSALEHVTRLIIPGVGSFPQAMTQLHQRAFIEPLHEHVIERRKPVLGICLGMQIMAELGTEFTNAQGLGWIPGKVVEIERTAASLRVPHVGWNDLQVLGQCPLLDGIEGDTACYFVHSYHLRATHDEHVMAACDYGAPVTAVVQRDHIFGVQPHPEKSQDVGLRMLANFAALPC